MTAAYQYAEKAENRIIDDLGILGFEDGMMRDDSFTTRLNCLNYLRTVRTGIELLETEVLRAAGEQPSLLRMSKLKRT